MKVPFVDLKAQFENLRPSIFKNIHAVLEKCNFILGEEVLQFESQFAKYCGVNYAVGVASGLDALSLSLRALNISVGDEVIVPANTFIATALAVSLTGAKPVFVDVNENNFLMDFNAVKKVITLKTKAIIPVHLYGRMMDLSPLLSMAKEKNIYLIEDAAQAHGATLHNNKAGSVGVLGCFSFYPGKNLGCYGDGGLITTNDKNLYEKLLALRNYGSMKKYYHNTLGYNSRLDTLQAAVLNAKLPYLDEYNQLRYEKAIFYNQSLSGIGDLVLPEIPEPGSHAFHLYVVRTKKINGLLQALQAAEISTVIHYPIPIHLQDAYVSLGYKKGDFPISEMLSCEILSLPLYPELTEQQMKYVVTQIKNFYKT